MTVSRILPSLAVVLICQQLVFAGDNTIKATGETESGRSANAQAAHGSGEPALFGDLITMTWVSGERSFATIDGGFFAPGDNLPGGGVVVDIHPGAVLIERAGEQQWVSIVDEPPPLEPSFMAGESAMTPLTYLDGAIDQLQSEIDALSSDPASTDKVARLKTLRDRLERGRDALASGEPESLAGTAASSELNDEWLAAQLQLDALRQRVTQSPGGLGLDELRATREILEQAMLSTLREPLSYLRDLGVQISENKMSGDLLHTVAGLLGEYPDYQALAEHLERQQGNNQN